MTTAQRSSPRRRLTEDAAISTAVRALLADRGESVPDLAYHTRISPASLYRKLGGEASWKAADVGAVARHYGVTPGDLFSGKPIGGGTPNTTEGVSRPTHEYSASERAGGLLRARHASPADLLAAA